MTTARMKLFALAFVAAGGSWQASAHATATFEWWNTQPLPVSNGRGHMAMDSSSNLFLTGLYSTTLTKFNGADGSVIWDVDIFDIDFNNGVYMTASGHVVVDSSGNAYVNGYVPDPVYNRGIVAVRKISPNGAILWTGMYDVGPSTEHSGGGPMAMGLRNDNLYVLGHSGNQSTNIVPVTLLRVSKATGAELGRIQMGTSTEQTEGLQDWRLGVDLLGSNVYCSSLTSFSRLPANLAAATWTYPKSVRSFIPAVNPIVPNVYVTGTEPGSAPGTWRMFVAKLVPATGAEVWKYTFGDQARPDYPGNDPFTPSNSTTYGGNAIRWGSDGSLFVVGNARFFSWNGAMVIKMNTSGGLQWVQQIGYDDQDSSCLDAVMDSSNNVYATCTSKQLHDFGSSAIAAVYSGAGVEKLLLWAEGPGGADDAFEQPPILGASGAMYLLEEAGTWNAGHTNEYFVPWIFKYTLSGI